MKNLITLLLFTACFLQAFSNDNNPTNNGLLTHEVYFNTDKFDLTSEESQKLISFIKEIRTIDIDRISIRGFCDDRGTNNYNLDLSNKRANAIKQFIANYKINKELIVNVNGEGEVGLSTSEQELFNQLRTLNRKVIIVVLPKKLIAGSFYAEEAKAGKTFNIKNLNFKMGLRYLNDDSTETLKELAAFLVKRKDIYFTVQGHVCCTKNGADSRDKETQRKNLSVVRAQFIRDYLVKQGVEAKRIDFVGLAGKYNLDKNAKDDRRVEIYIKRIAK